MEIKDEAKAALRALPEDVRKQIGYRLHQLQQDFSGDLKKLKGRERISVASGQLSRIIRVGWQAHSGLYAWRQERHLQMSIATVTNRTRTPKPSALDRQIAEAKVVLRQLRDTLEDLDDRRDLARAKKKNAGKPGTDWKTVKKELGL